MTQEEVVKRVRGGQLLQYEIDDAEVDEFAMELTFHLKRTEPVPYLCPHCGTVHKVLARIRQLRPFPFVGWH